MTVKNNLKRLTLGATIVLGMLIPNVAPAQPTTAPADQRNRDRGERRTMLLERLRPIIDDLQLSEEQKARVREIVDAAREQMREQLQQMRDLPPRERMERVRDKLQEVREQLGEVLSEDQRVEFDRRVEELQQRRRPEPGEPPATAPATAPAGEARGAGARRVGQFAERFRDAIDQLGLSDEQKAQASRIADDLGKRLAAAREQAAGDGQQLRTKAREILNDARQDLQEILSEEQREKLRELLDRGPQRPERAERMDAPERPDAMNEPAAAPATQGSGASPDGPRSEADPPSKIQLGQVAPDFALEKLDGRPVQLSSFKGRVLVILFGNYSSPTFRDRVDDFDLLRRQYASRAEFLIVYTRESHPVSGWEVERNKLAKVRVEQPKTMPERKALARQAKQALKITTPIALDTMDDKTATDYDGFTTCAVVVARDGTIVGYKKSADPHAVRRLLDEVIAGKS